MGMLNINFKMPDLSKFGSIGSLLQGKIDSIDISGAINSKIDGITSGFQEQISSTINDKISGITDSFEIPELDTSILNTSDFDLNSQMQEFLNNMDINSL